MAGTRDTEMAAGGWQPAFPPDHPFGDVHIFRMSLWAEHFRYTDQNFRFPGSLECVQMVKSMALYNWQVNMPIVRFYIVIPCNLSSIQKQVRLNSQK